jgi:hypothetical protein
LLARKVHGCGFFKVEPEYEALAKDMVYADFNNRDGRSLSLSCDGTKLDLKRLGLVLRDGLEFRVSDGELVGVGKVRWVPELQGG